ncbi:MAG: asparagine synthetase B, partial [Candidatus Omnitrophica bacterium]|nr:asparagine synthetase B [Candidatus Omnitrophota bacterium]
MCGIAGYYLKRNHLHPTNKITALLDPIRSRGPDDEGVCLISTEKKNSKLYRTDRTVSSLTDRYPSFTDRSSLIEHDLALVHTRFAIIDLSVAGHQPFVTQDGGMVLIFNGEIYNYLELKEEL